MRQHTISAILATALLFTLGSPALAGAPLTNKALTDAVMSLQKETLKLRTSVSKLHHRVVELEEEVKLQKELIFELGAASAAADLALKGQIESAFDVIGQNAFDIGTIWGYLTELLEKMAMLEDMFTGADSDGDGFVDAVKVNMPLHTDNSVTVGGSLFVQGTSFLGAADDGDPSKVVIVEGGEVYASAVYAAVIQVESLWLVVEEGAQNLEAAFTHILGVFQDNLSVDFEEAPEWSSAQLLWSWMEPLLNE